MTCRVCHDTRWGGWNFNGERIPCQWCNTDDPPPPRARNLRAERVAALEVAVSGADHSEQWLKAFKEAADKVVAEANRKMEATVSEKPTPAEEWQDVVSTKEGDYLDRIEVPGGWLYRTRIATGDVGEDWTVAMTFVPRAPLEYRSR